MTDKIVIIPTYNEKGNISRIIQKVFSLDGDFHLLIVDDNSPDGTAGIVERMQNEYPNQLNILKRAGKLGLGTAYIDGFRWALENGYEYIFEMDADFSHNPDDLIRLHKACADGADMSVGSRYVKGGGVSNWPWDRVLLSRGASIYVRLITALKVKDTTAGFVCYTSKVLEAIELDRIQFVGYAFQIEMKYATKKLGFSIAEVPITFTDREVGQSKMSGKIFKEAIFGVLIMRLQSFFGRSYRKDEGIVDAGE